MPTASVSGVGGGDRSVHCIPSQFDINSSQDLIDSLSRSRHLFVHLFAGSDGATEAI